MIFKEKNNLNFDTSQWDIHMSFKNNEEIGHSLNLDLLSFSSHNIFNILWVVG